jgi:hypothetical protein
VPFRNPKQRAIHFVRHGHEFGAINEFDYERLADAFMSAAPSLDLFECSRTSGTRDRVRLNALTCHYGVAYNIVILRTYFIRSRSEIARCGGPAAFVAAKCAEIR